MIAKPKNLKMVIFEDVLKEFRFDDRGLSLAEQICIITDKTGAQLISIGNEVMEAEDLISKLTQIELTLLKDGGDAATKLWNEFGLPKLKNYKERVKKKVAKYD